MSFFTFSCSTITFDASTSKKMNLKKESIRDGIRLEGKLTNRYLPVFQKVPLAYKHRVKSLSFGVEYLPAQTHQHNRKICDDSYILTKSAAAQ